MSRLKSSVEWDSERMGSMNLEDYKKLEYPAHVVVRKQGGGFFDIGRFETEGALKEALEDGLFRGPDQCDRICFYKKGA